MSQQQTLYHWCRCVSKQFPKLSKPQALVLAAFSLAVALARRCALPAAAEALPVLGKPDSLERRWQRFLSNQHMEWSSGCTALARWVIGALAPLAGAGLASASPVVLLVDETSLRQKLKVMAVSLAYRGRAIPLAWWCYPNDQWPLRQVQLIRRLLDWVAPAIPSGVPVVVEMDRGLGNSPALLRSVAKRGWYYLVRVCGGVRLRLGDGREVAFRELVVRRGQTWRGSVRAFKKAGWLDCWAIGIWDSGYQEPWLLLTNWPQAQSQQYGWRMWEELAFRDFKSGGWQWQKSRVTDPAHANRLWLVLALAYAWVVSLGTQVLERLRWRRELTRGRRRQHSVFALGLRLLTRWALRQRHLPFELKFILQEQT
jgi:hypothetical protein